MLVRMVPKRKSDSTVPASAKTTPRKTSAGDGEIEFDATAEAESFRPPDLLRDLSGADAAELETRERFPPTRVKALEKGRAGL